MSVWAIATSNLQARMQQPRNVPASRRLMPGAPEIYFNKAIDNSRLVKLDDPTRKKEMRLFTVAMAVLFVLCTVYVWQHFRAIQYGYAIEDLKAQRETLTEQSRELRLEEASLKDPERIDKLARDMGLQMPQVGQVQQMDASTDAGGPVMARAAGVSVVSITQ